MGTIKIDSLLSLKQNNLILTTTGSSGAATLVGSTLNIPVSAGGGTWGSITGTLSSQTDLNSALNAKAPIASPGLTGVPTAPTAATTTSTTQIATTAFVQQEITAQPKVYIANDATNYLQIFSGTSDSIGGVTAAANLVLRSGNAGGKAGLSALTVADIPVMTATTGGAVPTPPNDATKFLNGQGSYTVPAGSGGTTTSEQVLTATAAQTAFTFTSVPASYNDYMIIVNGGVGASTTAFTTSGNIVTTTLPLDAGDVVILRRIK